MRKFLMFLLLLTLAGLPACGGSGSGADDGSSQWDEMVWDRDDWA